MFRSKSANTLDPEAATNTDLPDGYDQPDSPWWVDPDLRQYYAADLDDFADWSKDAHNGTMPTDTERQYVAHKVTTDDAYWKQLLDSGIVNDRNADLRPERRPEVVPWLRRTPHLLATITDDDRARVAHWRRRTRAAAARDDAAKLAAQYLLYADSVTGEQHGYGIQHNVTLPDGRTLQPRTTLGMAALIESIAVQRYGQQVLPDGRTRAQAANDWLDGGATPSRPMIDLSVDH